MLLDTGKIIETYLEENNITIDQLKDVCGVSSRTIIRVLKGESKLSYEIAKGINTLIPEISIEFLITYDAKYQLQKKQYEEENNVDNIDFLIDKFQLKYLYPNLKSNKKDLFEKGIKIFGLENMKKEYIDNVNILKTCFFSETKNGISFNKDLWIRAAYCEYKENENILDFNDNDVATIVESIKKFCGTIDRDITLYNMKKISNQHGINFYYRDSIPNSKIKAVTVMDNDNKIYIFASNLYKCIENLWISFMHEIIHINKKDYINSVLMLDDYKAKNENFVSEEAAKAFIGDEYLKIDNCDIDTVFSISKKCNIPPGIVAEITRYKTKNYSNREVNSLVHYYES